MLLIAGTLAFTSCTQNKTNAAPEADKDLTGATDVGIVQLIASDLNEIAAQTCDGTSSITASAYSYPSTMSIPNTTLTSFPAIPTNNVVGKIFTVTFNNTLGMDGKVRNGVISFDYNTSLLGALFYRQVEFRAVCTSTGYTVGDVNKTTGAIDAYSVTINNMVIHNTTPQGFNKATTDLTWSQTTNLTIAKPNGGGTITFVGDQTKDLLNTNITNTVVAPYVNSTTPIKWSYARTGWYGNATGTLANNGGSFSTSIVNATALTRDYTCSPEKLVYPEKHPFMSGYMTLKINGKADRYYDYGLNTCDYNVRVTINGISYPVDIN